jgi:two-component system, OmpR family, response regulator RegX3
MAQRVLVIEDETAIAEGLAYNLRQEGLEPILAADGDAGLQLARTAKPDLILLDLMLPGIGGLDVCRAIRRESDVPIIMLTAKDAEIDKIVGFEIGADDYITKPFSIREVLVRIRAVLRRAGSRPESDAEEIQYGGLVVNFAKHSVTVDGRLVTLSPKEFDLLKILIRNRGRVMTRDLLLDRVWGEDAYVEPRTVDVHIRWLREKIEQDPSHPVLIQTVRGAGYRFTD